MRQSLIDTVSASYSLHPNVVRSLLAPLLKGDLAEAASLEELKSKLTPAVLHQLRYNLSIVERGQRTHDLVTRYLTPRASPSVLDIGSGFGGMLLPFGKQGFDLHGIEPDAARQKMCEQNLSHLGLTAKFHDVDLCTHSLGEQRFDVIICNSVIEHVSDPVAMIQRIGAMLSPGGVLFFGVANKDALGSAIADPHYGVFGLTLMPNGLARRFYLAMAEKPQNYSVVEFFSIECYQNLLQAAIGSVHVGPDPEHRTHSEFSELLARVTAAYQETLAGARLASDRMLRRQFELIFLDYISRASSAYVTAIENGTFKSFTDVFIRKSYQLVAVKT